MKRVQNDLPTAGAGVEWSCGHIASAMCAECYLLLLRRANELAEENLRLREELDR